MPCVATEFGDPNTDPNPNPKFNRHVNSGGRARNLSRLFSTCRVSQEIHRYAVRVVASTRPRRSHVNLFVSFSAWAELVWRYLLEVTNPVNPSSIPDTFHPRISRSENKNVTLTLTLTLTHRMGKLGRYTRYVWTSYSRRLVKQGMGLCRCLVL